MSKCPNCGANVSSSDKRCSKCGCELNKKSSNKVLIFIIAIVVILICGSLAYFTLQSDNSDDDSSTVYWASSKTNKFHLPTCKWAQNITDSNKLVFTSREDAIASGREACEVCKP